MPYTHKTLLLALLLLVSLSAFGQARIDSVTPNSGPVAGGTLVTIRISGFSTCNPCAPVADPVDVFFGNVPATNVTVVNATTITAVTPQHLPGVTSVMVHFEGYPAPNFASLDTGFTYTGTITDAFEPVLFPILMRPVRGAFGSEFVTEGRFTTTARDAFTIYGEDTTCTLFDPPLGVTTARPLSAQFDYQLYPECYPEGTVGRLFYVPRGRSGEFAANVRVYETTKQSENHGIEIPLVREHDFQPVIALLGVPVDPKFRLTLRIYSLADFEGQTALVTAGNQHFTVPLQRSTDPFAPSYAVFGDFQIPANATPGTTMRVTINGPSVGIPLPPPSEFWAFITVTNNETQHITTITP